MSDPETYSEVMLGRPNDEYCRWILKPESWGGATERVTIVYVRPRFSKNATVYSFIKCGGAGRRD